MSASTRQAIAAAASTVDGVHVFPYFKQTTKPGDGLVRLDRVDYPNPFGGLVTWQVVVMLPQDQESAEKWLDKNGEALRDAVAEALIVRSMFPQIVALPDGQSMAAVVIEGQREEE